MLDFGALHYAAFANWNVFCGTVQQQRRLTRIAVACVHRSGDPPSSRCAWKTLTSPWTTTGLGFVRERW